MSDRIQVRRDTEADWTSNNPTLQAGEPGYITDTAQLVVGDGTTAFSALPRLKIADGPRGVLGYAEVTAAQTISGTSADLTGLTVTVTVEADRRVKVTGHGVTKAHTNERCIIDLLDGSDNKLGALEDREAHVGNQEQQYDSCIYLTPSAGSNTYKLHYRVISGTGHSHQAATGVQAFILVEDIGPAS